MMRITNSMMMTTTKTNINNNKVTVDRLNTQMSTQKKITKPSDNPLIAIKSLRLSTTLSQINQYYDNNIKDAQSWMDVTETALTNMKDIFQDAYRLAVNGATDTLSDEDRSTILEQLRGLSDQLYAEANADYANRTVFTGYKTNSTVTFTDAYEASNASYEICEQLKASAMETYKYYANTFDTPTSADVTANTTTKTPEEIVLNRLRLAYNKLQSLNNFSYNYSVDTTAVTSTGSTSGNVTLNTDAATGTQDFQWRSLNKDSAFTYTADANGVMTGATLEDMSGYTINIGTNGSLSVDDSSVSSTVRTTVINGVTTKHTTFTDADGNTLFIAKEETQADGTKTAYIIDSQGSRVDLTYDTNGNLTQIADVQGNTINTNLDQQIGPDDAATISITKSDGTVALIANIQVQTDANGASIGKSYAITTADKGLTTEVKLETMTQTEFEAYLADYAEDPDKVKEEYENTIIYLPDSGELIIGSKLAETLASQNATLDANYDKTGFEKGETRPEMYFNCTNKTDISPANHITYTNFDADGNWIAQSINYTIAANQEMAINTQIHDVVSADCYRDLSEMADLVQTAIDAHTTVTNIQAMIDSGDYSDGDLTYLQDCLEKAKKQMDYADDNLKTICSKQITRFENYMQQVNLTITNVGTKGDQVSLAENRMSNQKTTFTELKSNNEDAEISDIVIDYTSAYTAYQASLQAAGKISDMTLLDYI